MQKSIRLFLPFLLVILMARFAVGETECPAPAELDRYNVAWSSPGKSDRDSMPLGNGEVGISLWVQEDGDLMFYIARSDSQTETDRNVKLGKVRVRLEPNPFAAGRPFSQKLILRRGVAEIAADGSNLRVFVDSGSPVIHVTGEMASPTKVTATLQNWRTEPQTPPDSCVSSAPVKLAESADIVKSTGNAVLFYHRNERSCIPLLAELQGLKDQMNLVPDTLGNRMFGGWMTLSDSSPASDASLETVGSVKKFAVKIATHSAQTSALEEWVADLRRIHAGAPDAAEALQRTAAWWESYWGRSWIFVSGDENAERVTRAYILTKWMFACAGRGNLPIRYNGALFNLMPSGDGKVSIMTLAKYYTEPPLGEPSLTVNPDIRPWGHNTLYQNVRLPYYSMLARGETDSVRVLFAYYRRFWDLNRERAKLYYNARGQHNTEMTQTFGLQEGGVYGYDRSKFPPGYAQNRWGGAVDISPGLELLNLMLDYYDYTRDDEFLKSELLPYSHDLLEYVQTRFSGRENGKIVIGPLQSVETYWDTTDPIPTVAGMHAVLRRILELPEKKVADRDFFLQLRSITPDIPMETVKGRKFLAPARIYDPKRRNVESPQFYAVFPFRVYCAGKADLDLAIDSFRHASEVAGSFQPFQFGWKPDRPSYSGWQHHGPTAALLGLSKEAREVLVHNARLNNPGNRFEAMWGPVYDAVPDVDHGANILNTLQLMAFQADGKRIRLFPAWPKEWDAEIKFHAPGDTVVQASIREGKVTVLRGTPENRASDMEGGR